MAKKYLFVLLCLSIGGGAALFALGQKSQKKSDAPSIAVIMPNATHGFLGESIRHDEFVRGKSHINGIESFWSFAKRSLAKFNGLSDEKFYIH